MPSFRYELLCEGRVAGIDEAGRGPLAGPVVAAVAVIDRSAAKRRLLKLINDSKQLVVEDREAAYEAMVASGIVQFAVAEATVEEIDRINILQATFLAMRRALQALADRYMARLAESFPGYGWETNRGYGSEEHLVALQCLGPTPHHRMSFSPLNRLL